MSQIQILTAPALQCVKNNDIVVSEMQFLKAALFACPALPNKYIPEAHLSVLFWQEQFVGLN